MSRRCRSLLGLMLLLAGVRQGFSLETAPKSQRDSGKSFIPVKAYSKEDDDKVLKLYQGLRVADVSDGMDIVGLQDIGLMDPEIKALWRDTQSFEHRVCGIAVT